MTEVLLINPPFLRVEGYHHKVSAVGTQSAPPLGLAYLAGYLEKNGIGVAIVDALAERLTLADIEKRVREHSPAVVGVTATTPMVVHALETIRLAKRVNPGTVTVLGGPHATAAAEETLKACLDLDYAAVGEGENTLLELVMSVRQKAAGSTPAGLVFRKGAEFVRTVPRPLIADLDQIPFPARRLLPMKLYSPSPVNYRKKPATSVICSRGCPMRCIFCTKTIYGSKLRLRSPENVFREVQSLKDDYGIREVHFYDDTFTMNAAWVRETCDLIGKLRLTWWCNGRVSNISEDTLRRMKDAGCYRIYYGVESGNDKSLRLLRKKTDTEMIARVFRMTRKVGIEAAAFMMFGIPGEDAADMQRSIDFVRAIKADHAVFSTLTPYPGTEVHERAAEFGRLAPLSWDKFVMISDEPAFVPYSATADDLRRAMSRAYRSVAFRPRFVLQKAREVFYSPSKLFPYLAGLVSLFRR